MVRQRLISGVAGLALAVGIKIAFPYLVPQFNMSLHWADRSGLLWSSLGLGVVGVVIGALARLKSGSWTLAVVPAVLLGLGYTLRGPLTLGWD